MTNLFRSMLWVVMFGLVVLSFSGCQTLPTRVIHTAEEVWVEMDYGNKLVLMNDKEGCCRLRGDEVL